ncbi:uncharacterized protein TNCV_5041071 [Trichonephila clavipes]|nr:uncharacterized protein TNCV_5041071 [Trichonephila clavipes]
MTSALVVIHAGSLLCFATVFPCYLNPGLQFQQIQDMNRAEIFRPMAPHKFEIRDKSCETADHVFLKTKKPLSTTPQRGRVIGLRKGGFSFHDMAERLDRNVSSVHHCWEQWSRDGTASRRSGSGRPCGSTYREDHRIHGTAVAHRTTSVVQIRAAVGTTGTQRTVRNRFL